jgi:threonine dehydrogenase-like Zn-dependent dehydrogenase
MLCTTKTILATTQTSLPSSALSALPKPEAVFVACYPNEAVAIMRSVNEIGLGSQVQIFGGGMVGLQFGPVMQRLRKLAQRCGELQLLCSRHEISWH